MQLEILLARPLPEDMPDWIAPPAAAGWSEDWGAELLQYETVEDDGKHVCVALNNRNVVFIAHQYGTPGKTGRRVTFAAFGHMTVCDAIGTDFQPAVSVRNVNVTDAQRTWRRYASVHQLVFGSYPA